MTPCPFCGGPNAGGLHPHLSTCPWQRGKLDVECAECGRREAAGVKCSGCYHVHGLSEYLPHADPRALHYHATGPVRTAGQPVEPPIKAVAALQAPYNASPSIWEAAR